MKTIINRLEREHSATGSMLNRCAALARRDDVSPASLNRILAAIDKRLRDTKKILDDLQNERRP